MSRASAKARVRKRKLRAQAVLPVSDIKSQRAVFEQPRAARMFTSWYWAGITILAGAAFIRLFQLTAPVLHHDEGVNGVFLANLFRTGYYHYDPGNYHGPTLYYFGWITTTINSFFYGKDGLSTWAMKLVTALFGIGIVWLVLCLRRQLGSCGALAAGALAAVSPGFVYFSRYFIHEILFIFFSLGVIVALLWFRQTSSRRYLMLAAMSAALLGATKETWVITVAVWLIAIPCTRLYCRIRSTPPERQGIEPSPPPTKLEPRENAVTEWSKEQTYAVAALLFVVVWVLFYSSFFTNFPQGLYDSVRTFSYWFKTGASSPHDSSWDRYFDWLKQEEATVLILGGWGVITALWQARNRFAVFTAFWSLGIFAAYSLVSYKTPWLAVNIVLPLVLMAGYGLEQFWERRAWRPVAALALTLAVTLSLYQAIELSFFHYDDDRPADEGGVQKYPYVYAHSNRQLLDLVHEVDYIASGNAAGKDIGLIVLSPEHWPLPWYFRDYTHVGFWGKVVDTSEPILVVHEDQVPEVERMFGSKYRLINSYILRPGNRLYLYLRRDVQP